MDLATLLLLAYVVAKVIKLIINTGIEDEILKTTSKVITASRKLAAKIIRVKV